MTIRRRFVISDYFPAYGGNLLGTEDCTRAINAAAADLQKNRGGELVFPAGKVSVFGPASGRNSFYGFADLAGIRLSSEKCEIVIDESASPYTGVAQMFAFTNCEDVEIDGFSTTGPAVDSAQRKAGIRGWIFAGFYGACRRITAPHNRFANVVAPFIVNPEQGGTGRSSGIRIGRLEVDNAIYGFHCQNNGDDVRIEALVCNDCHRDYFVYGVRGHHVRIFSRNTKGRNLANSAPAQGAPAGCSDLDISLVERGTIDSTDFNIKFAVMIDENPSQYRNCHFHFDIEYVMPPVAALAHAGPGNLAAGTYRYRVTFVSEGKETKPTAPSNGVTVRSLSGNTGIRLSGIPTGEGIPGLSARKLYRSRDGLPYKLAAVWNEASTTVYIDNAGERALGANAPEGQIHTGGQAFLLDKAANGRGTLNGHDQTDRGHQLHGWTFTGRIQGTPTYFPLGHALETWPETRWGTGESFREWTFRNLSLVRAGGIDFQMDPLKDVCKLDRVSADDVVRLRQKDSLVTTKAGRIEATLCDIPNLFEYVPGPPEAYPLVPRPATAFMSVPGFGVVGAAAGATLAFVYAIRKRSREVAARGSRGLAGDDQGD